MRAPTYGPLKVAVDRLPDARMGAHETDASTGVGIQRAKQQQGMQIAETGAQAAGLFGRMAAEERQRADETALLEATNKLAEWQNKRLYDPETGAFGVKGKNAMPLPETVGAEYDKLAGEVESTLNNDRQRAAFARERASRKVGIDTALRRHVFGEMQTYENGELVKYIENSSTAAIANANDPKQIKIELDGIVDKITLHAGRAGMGPEQTKAAIEDARTRVHIGVVERLLENGADRKAQIYFDANKSEIAGDKLGKVEQALEQGTVRGQAQKITQEILGQGGTLSEQRAKANQIDDPKVQDEVKQRLEHEDAVKERDERDRAEGTMKKAYDILDHGGSVEDIAPAQWASFTGGTRSALRSYALQRTKGEPIETDLPTYYALMEQAAGDPATFAKQNLLNYRHKLSETDFKHVTGLLMSTRAGDKAKLEKDLAGFRTKAELVNDSLVQYGIDPKEKPAAVAQLRRMVDERVDADQAQGHKVDNARIQGHLDAILGMDVKTPGSWWALINPIGYDLSDRKTRLIDATVGDIPASDRTQVEEALRQRGHAVTDATVLNLWLQHRVATSAK